MVGPRKAFVTVSSTLASLKAKKLLDGTCNILVTKWEAVGASQYLLGFRPRRAEGIGSDNKACVAAAQLQACHSLPCHSHLPP